MKDEEMSEGEAMCKHGLSEVITIMNDTELLNRIKERVEYANAHHVTREEIEAAFNRPGRKMHFDVDQVVKMPNGNEFVFAVEDQPMGPTRHIAGININEGKVMNPMVMAALMKLCGFRHGLEGVMNSPEVYGWEEQIPGDRLLVNVIEAIEPGIKIIPEGEEE